MLLNRNSDQITTDRVENSRNGIVYANLPVIFGFHSRRSAKVGRLSLIHKC